MPTSQEVQDEIDSLNEDADDFANLIAAVQVPQAPQPSQDCSTELAFKNAAEAVKTQVQAISTAATALADAAAGALQIAEAFSDAATQAYNECIGGQSG